MGLLNDSSVKMDLTSPIQTYAIVLPDHVNELLKVYRVSKFFFQELFHPTVFTMNLRMALCEYTPHLTGMIIIRPYYFRS